MDTPLKEVKIEPVFSIDKQEVIERLDSLKAQVERGEILAICIGTFGKDIGNDTAFQCHWDGLKSHVLAAAFHLHARLIRDMPG